MTKAKPTRRKRKNERPEPKTSVNISINFDLPKDSGFYMDLSYIQEWVKECYPDAEGFSISIRKDDARDNDFYF